MTKTHTAPETESQEWYTPAEAAAYLRVTRQTVYNYMDQGLLPYYSLKSGKGRRLRRSDLDSFLEGPLFGSDSAPDNS